MLADWYLCTTQGLSARETHVYLDALRALDEPAERVHLAEEAVNQLRRVEPGLMLYALPRLLASYRGHADRPSFAARAKAYLADLDVLTGGHAELRSAFDALDEYPRRLRAKIAVLAETISAADSGPEGDGAPPEPYDDLFSTPLATTAMALAAELAARSAETAREWLDTGDPELVSDALAGRFGRLPFLLAVRFSAWADASAENRERLLALLWRYGRGAADLEPDLVAEAARLSRPEPFDVRAALTEAVTGIDLAAWRAHEPAADPRRRQAAQARWGGRTPRQAGETAAVLWQAGLWRVAAERDPVATIAELRTWWAAPTLVDRSERVAKTEVPITVPFGADYEAAWGTLSTLAGLRSWDQRRQAPKLRLTDGPVTEMPADSATLVGCPWLFRAKERWHANKERNAYPEWNDPPSLVRLSAAAALAVDLLDAVAPGPDEDFEHLLALLIMMRDVATVSPLREAIDPRATVTGQRAAPALVSLYHHALRAADRCAKGDGPHDVPRRIVRLLTDGPGSAAACKPAPTQWRRLMLVAGPMTAQWWLRETVSGGWVEDEEDGHGWFSGAAPTPAARLLRLLLAERLDLDAAARNAPALLERDLRPPGAHAAGWGWRPHQEPEWDWLPKVETYGPQPEGDEPGSAPRPRFIGANVLLLAPRHDLQVWRRWSTRLVRALGDEPAPQALLTVRLQALLHSPGNAGDLGEWVEEWAQNIMRRVEPRELARVVRRRMIELMRAPIEDHASETRVTRVGELVIDTILDLSRGAQWYQQLLLGALGTVAVPESVATQWRYRAVGTLYRLGDEPPSRTAISPHEATGARHSTALTADAVRCLLFRHGGARIVGQEATLGQAVETLWRELRTSPPVARQESPLSEIDPTGRGEAAHDHLTTLAVQLDRYRGTQVTYRDSRGADLGRIRGRRPDPFVTRTGRGALVSGILGRQEDSYGIVCAVDPVEHRAWVNAGFGRPAECKLASSDALPAVGDLVVAAFTGTPAHPRVDGLLRPLARPLDPRDVRAATVRALPGSPWLSVEIDGASVFPGLHLTDENAGAARWRWDPDLSRRHAGTGTEAVDTVARWDEAIGHWVPVDRGGQELIAGEPDLLAGGVRLVLAGQVTDDEDTRLRFVTRPGRAYLLGSADFAPGSWDALLGLVGDGLPGLAVTVGPAEPDGRLTLLGEAGEANREWLRLFDERDDEGDLGAHVAYRTPRGWRLRLADPPAGFPAEVTITGLEGSAEEALCLVTEWGEPQARAAAVAAEPLEDRGVPRPADASAERWNDLAGLPAAARIRLRAIVGANLRRDSLLGFTEDGLRIQLPTESVALAAVPAVIRQFGWAREVIVDSDRLGPPVAKREAVAVATEQLLRLSGSPGLAEVLAGAQSLTGMVVQQVRDKEHTVHYGVWLRHGTRVSHAVVPEPAFSAPAEVGDHLDFRRSGDGWVVGHVRRRTIRGRALYTGEAKAGRDWLPVGEVERDGRQYTVLQAPDRPALATAEVADRPTGKHTVTRLGDRSWIRNGRSEIRVLVERGNRFYAGDAAEFPAGSLMRVRGTTVRLETHRGEDGPRYTVRRTFGLEAVIRQPVRPTVVSTELEHKRWERALRDGNQHMVGARDGDRLALPGFRAPLPDGRLAGWLPLREGELPLVDGQAYDNGSVRVCVEDVDDGHMASFARAVPLAVDGFAEALSLDTGGDRAVLRDPLYYVGTETGRHRFEWGYGWTVDVPDGALTIDGEPVPAGRMFHGDRVEAVRLARDPAAPGGIAVHLAGRDVATALSGQLMRESAAGMIHYVRVEVDLDSGRVAVIGVHTQRQRGTDERIEVTSHPVRAEVEETTAAALVERERRRQKGGSGTVTRLVYGRLDTSADALQGRRKMFALIDPGRLKEDDLLYARAGRIVDVGNELCLELRPLGPAGRKWTVSVARRQFSPQFGLLARQLRSPGGELAYDGKLQVMVRLLKKAPNRSDRWHGSVVNTPSRPESILESWVRHRGAACFGVLARDGRLEVSPGVFYDASHVPGARQISPGTLVRLTASGPGRKLTMEVAVPSDLRYVREGRPVIALPKNSLLGPGGLGLARNGNPFTLADLPTVEAAPHRDLDPRAVLRTPHPKIVYAFSPAGTDRVQLRRIDPRTVAGTLELDTPGRARLVPAGAGSATEIDWAQLSFAEGSIASLRRAMRDGTWEYHDAATGYWDAQGRECQPQELGPGTIERWPVFFADGPTLRYPRDQLPRLGLPAAELLDRPIPEGSPEETYVVAGTTVLNDLRALWLELSPGRVAEIPVALFASRRGSLADLDWTQLHPGDQVTVRRHRNEQTGHVTLELRGWQPGMRGAWSGSPAIVLPVVEADREAGALRLGAGDHSLWYPAEPEVLDRFPAGTRTRLTRSNRLTAAQVRTDDTVLLVAGDDGYGLAGLDDVEVALADEGWAGWPGAAWLRDLLADPAASAGLLAGLGGALPVTVDALRRHEDRLVVTVSRRNQPPSRTRRGILRTQVVTSVRGSLILRSGHALYRIPADRAVPGLDSAAVATTAAALRDRGTVLWWHHDQDELRCGTTAGGGQPEPAVRVEMPISVDGRFLGLVCREAETGALGWLPWRLASWIGVADPRLPAVLAAHRRIPMARNGQRFSVVDRPATAREHRLIEVGSVLSAVVVALPTDDHPAYLVRTVYTEVVLTLTAPPGLALADRVLAEVNAVRGGRHPQVTTVPTGTRRAELDVPRPIGERLAQISTGTLDGDWDRRYRQFAEAWRAPECPADPDAAVVWSASHGADPGHLAAWLAAGGRDALAGQGEHDLAPMLAACLVAAELGESDARHAGLAVLVAHQVGRRAIRSLHVEPLVRGWITEPQRQTAPGPWEQVRRFGLATEMEPEWLGNVVQRCKAILAKPVLHGSEDLRAPVAHAVLVAAGAPARPERFDTTLSWRPDAPLLGELAALGRALTPPAGQPLAQPALLPAQRQILIRAAEQAIGRSLPLVLLPPLGGPPAQWHTLL